MYQEMRKKLTIYEEAVIHIWLYKCSTQNFLIYEENFLFLFISVVSSICKFSISGELNTTLGHWKTQHPLPILSKKNLGNFLIITLAGPNIYCISSLCRVLALLPAQTLTGKVARRTYVFFADTTLTPHGEDRLTSNDFNCTFISIYCIVT